MQESRPTKQQGRAALLAWQRDRLAAWDTLHLKQDRLLLGVTATAKRGDNIGLECIFQDTVFSRTIREMVERGRLSGIRAYRVDSATNLDGIGIRAGDFEQEKLGEAVNVAARNTVAVKAYQDYGENRKGLTFCVNVAHAKALAEAYQAVGISAVAVYGAMKPEDRKRALADFKAGRIRMLCNAMLLVEGYDEPDIQIIVHAKPTKSSLLYIQMTGRGLRTAPGKKDCIIIDIVDVTKKHSLFTSPELFGLPVGFDAKGGDVLAAKQQIEKLAEDNSMVNLADAKSIDECKLRVSEVDLLESFHDDVVEKHTALAWVRTGEGYEISWSGLLLNEFLSVSPGKEGWKVEYKQGKKTKWEATLPDAKSGLARAESWLKQNHRSVFTRSQRTTSTNPASQNMKDMVASAYPGLNVQNLTYAQGTALLGKKYHESRKYKTFDGGK
jgi:superfamily II DNA/RNA helicase